MLLLVNIWKLHLDITALLGPIPIIEKYTGGLQEGPF